MNNSLKSIKKILEKKHYAIVGNTSAVQVCQWTKNSLNKNGVCWKENFYGIKSHRCCQISPAVMWCENRCLHCWRPIEYNLGTKLPMIDKPEEIINGVIKARKKLLLGFGGNTKVSKERLEDSFNPTLFTFSLAGEATLYPKLGEMIKNLRKRKIITFLVTNGLNSKAIKKLETENELPTQLTLSLNVSNKQDYRRWHNSSKKNAWEELNKTLVLIKKLKGKTRRAIRLNLVKADGKDNSFIGKLSNMKEEHVKEYAKLIKKAMPDFIHVDGFKSIGASRGRMSWKKMPNFDEVKSFAVRLQKELKDKGYKIMGEEPRSAVVMLSNRKKSELKIKKA